MSKVRFGLIGAGQIGFNAADILRKNENADIVAAHDLSAERLEALCQKAEIESRYATASELFADKRVDAVYIAVPNKFHAPMAIEALEAGKHVILEKPFAMNSSEAEAVVAAAKKSGKIFTLGMNQRFVEKYQKIRTLVNDGVLGDIYHAKAMWLRRSGIPKLGTWFGRKELAGGGCLNDIGVHALDLCLATIGNFEPVSVFGATYTRFGNRGLGEGKWGMSDRTESVFDVDDFATALIRFKNGMTVAMDASWACHMPDPARMELLLYGDDAGANVTTASLFRADPLRPDYDVIPEVRADIRYPHCCRFANFINAILGKEEIEVTPEQALVVQRILDAVQESCRTGKEVSVAAK